jgi:hypothetical protein
MNQGDAKPARNPADETSDTQDEAPSARGLPAFHMHMALAHIPCGVFVTAFVLCLLGTTALKPALGPSAKVCFLAGAAALPFVVVSGLLAWKRKRSAGASGVFRMKLVWSILLLAAALATAGPEFSQQEPTSKFPYGIALCAALAFVLARMGSMIVFERLGLPDEQTTQR